ncbi:MAG TPA: aminoacyl-tRNA hydrolase [Sedimenticola sp.]|nr:aminoacyl-tRNA hydrolase [Sedimenticola sp.]
MKLIAGLGNPGPRYQDTRHNAGFWFVDLLARRHGGNFRRETRFHGESCRIRAHGRECWLLKPDTFMNRSGQSVSSLARYFRIPPEEILVAHDELDLPAGAVRLKKGGGHAGHNGLRDIMAALGSREFWRLRIGIDRPADSRQVVDYVLGRPSRRDAEAIEAVLEAAADALPEILEGKFQRAMNRLHVRGA